MMRDFYDIAELEISEIESLLRLAEKLEGSADARRLEGRVMAMLFMNPSLRTLTSFQASMSRLGGGTFVVSPDMSIHGLETRAGIVMDGTAAEHIREAVPVIASYADVIGIRALASRKDLMTDLADTTFNELRELCDIPVINLESAVRHPCQALADWKTLDDLRIPTAGGKLVFSWVYHPEALPLAVPGDVVHMAALRGMDVTLLRPDEFALPEPIEARALEAADTSGGSFRQSSEPESSLCEAHVVYAGSWAATQQYGDAIADRKARDLYEQWRIDEAWFGKTNKKCLFMHCLPVRRGVEVEDEILDGNRSVVVQQAKNRMFAQMAVLTNLLS